MLTPIQSDILARMARKPGPVTPEAICPTRQRKVIEAYREAMRTLAVYGYIMPMGHRRFELTMQGRRVRYGQA